MQAALLRASQQAQVPRAAPASSYYKARLKLCSWLLMRPHDCVTDRQNLASRKPPDFGV